MRIILSLGAATDDTLRAVIDRAREAGHPIDVRVAWEGSDAATFAREAAARGDDRVIAVGGDGTINQVASGLYSGGGGPALGVVPSGTGNDFARLLYPPDQAPAPILEGLITSTVDTPLDVICADDALVVNVASGGFVAEVTPETPEALKSTLGGLAYLFTGLKKAVRPKSHHLKVVADARTLDADVVAVFVGNGRFAGGGFDVCPEANVSDGLMEVTLVHAGDRDAEGVPVGTLVWEWLRRDSEDPPQHIERFRARALTVEADSPLQFNFDGEPMVGERFGFEVRPGALRLLHLDPGSQGDG